MTCMKHLNVFKYIGIVVCKVISKVINKARRNGFHILLQQVTWCETASVCMNDVIGGIKNLSFKT